jgi:beta-galactosidase beta subunit
MNQLVTLSDGPQSVFYAEEREENINNENVAELRPGDTHQEGQTIFNNKSEYLATDTHHQLKESSISNQNKRKNWLLLLSPHSK